MPHRRWKANISMSCGSFHFNQTTTAQCSVGNDLIFINNSTATGALYCGVGLRMSL